MKQLAISTTTGYDLKTAALPGILIRLDGTDTYWADAGVAHLVKLHVRIGTAFKLLDATANLTLTPYVGPAEGTVKPVINYKGTILAGSTIVVWDSDPIALTILDDTISLYIHSDNANDDDVTVIATVLEVGSALTDANGRTDVGLVGGTTPISSTGWLAKLISFLQRH